MHKGQTWKNQQDHFISTIKSKWYQTIFKIQSNIFYKTAEFYKTKEVSAVFFPITTGSISSPMGLGSDSLPVKVNLMGVDTYLADSMQFMLEYACRFNPNGAYYIMPSFRGEKADERHLCQFIHS